MDPSKTSIQVKILAALVAVFLSLMIATTWHTAASERAMASELARQKAFDTATSFFDGVNTMMLTGTMAQLARIPPLPKLVASPGSSLSAIVT